jgi:hypothetical protein
MHWIKYSNKKTADTTIDIVEAFAKMRKLSNMVAELVKSPDDTQKQAGVIEKQRNIVGYGYKGKHIQASRRSKSQRCHAGFGI